MDVLSLFSGINLIKMQFISTGTMCDRIMVNDNQIITRHHHENG